MQNTPQFRHTKFTHGRHIRHYLTSVGTSALFYFAVFNLAGSALFIVTGEFQNFTDKEGEFQQFTDKRSKSKVIHKYGYYTSYNHGYTECKQTINMVICKM